MKLKKELTFFEHEEYCRICDDFHTLLHGCKAMTPKFARNYLDQAIIETEKKLYSIELEKFRRVFE